MKKDTKTLSEIDVLWHLQEDIADDLTSLFAANVIALDKEGIVKNDDKEDVLERVEDQIEAFHLCLFPFLSKRTIAEDSLSDVLDSLDVLNEKTKDLILYTFLFFHYDKDPLAFHTEKEEKALFLLHELDLRIRLGYYLEEMANGMLEYGKAFYLPDAEEFRLMMDLPSEEKKDKRRKKTAPTPDWDYWDPKWEKYWPSPDLRQRYLKDLKDWPEDFQTLTCGRALDDKERLRTIKAYLDDPNADGGHCQKKEIRRLLDSLRKETH